MTVIPLSTTIAFELKATDVSEGPSLSVKVFAELAAVTTGVSLVGSTMMVSVTTLESSAPSLTMNSTVLDPSNGSSVVFLYLTAFMAACISAIV